jgi:hypothetical protein
MFEISNYNKNDHLNQIIIKPNWIQAIFSFYPERLHKSLFYVEDSRHCYELGVANDFHHWIGDKRLEYFQNSI